MYGSFFCASLHLTPLICHYPAPFPSSHCDLPQFAFQVSTVIIHRAMSVLLGEVTGWVVSLAAELSRYLICCSRDSEDSGSSSWIIWSIASMTGEWLRERAGAIGGLQDEHFYCLYFFFKHIPLLGYNVEWFDLGLSSTFFPWFLVWGNFLFFKSDKKQLLSKCSVSGPVLSTSHFLFNWNSPFCEVHICIFF